MKRICVFAGSNSGTNSEYQQQARALGEEFVNEGIELVYGGSQMGLMGEIANTMLGLGGKVIGIMPIGLFRGEIVHRNLTQLIEVKDMHERKAIMGQMSDGFISLPGGFGTFEELFEVVSWAQIGLYDKPIGLLNTAGFYDPILELVDHTIKAGFVKSTNRGLLLSDSHPSELLAKMKQYERPIQQNKWDK